MLISTESRWARSNPRRTAVSSALSASLSRFIRTISLRRGNQGERARQSALGAARA